MNTYMVIDENIMDAIWTVAKNTGGETIKKGDAVVMDGKNIDKQHIIIANSANNPYVLGIADENIEPGESGKVIIKGKTKVKVRAEAEAIAVGDTLVTSAVKGVLGKGTGNVIAIALESVPAQTIKVIVVWVRR